LLEFSKSVAIFNKNKRTKNILGTPDSIDLKEFFTFYYSPHKFRRDNEV